jgi:DNA polymerase-3 subunit delta'
MTYELIIGHERQKDILRRAVSADRLAHAYLFEGPEGIGKRLMALALVRAIFCENGNGCGDCAPCRKVDHNNHPDLHLFEPDGKQIKIEQIRELQRELSFRPLEAKKKVCLIDQADKMNPSAANSLLKTLEEPTDNTLIILLSSRPEALLVTVRSRCQRLPFSRLPQKNIEEALQNNRDLDPRSAHVLAALAEGSFLRALGRDQDFYLEKRREILKSVTGLSPASILPLLELAKEMATEKEQAPDLLEVLQSFYRDLLVYQQGRPENALINIDLMEKIKRVSRHEDTFSLLRKLEAIQDCRKNLDRNVNLQLNLEVLLLSLAA